MSLSNEAFNSTVDIMLNTNSTNNDTNLANVSRSGDRGNPFEDFHKAAFGSAIFMFLVSFITILANSLLLLILCIDPLKIFRNPTTYFLIGLAIVDLLQGLVQEPIYATCFMLLYFQHPSRKKCIPFMNAALYFSGFCIASSLIIVFAFTVTQYIVVSSPLKYGRLVTKRKVLISVMVVYLYSATFRCLHLIGVPPNVQNMMELFVHEYFLLLISIAFYILLHHTIRKKMVAGNSLRNENSSHEGKQNQVQRNFALINVTLILILILCFLPSIVVWTIRRLTNEAQSPSVKVLIGHLMVDNLFYLKFLLDPFVYAWRMPKYRESLSKIVCRKNICRESSRNGNENRLGVGEVRDGGLSTLELNRSVITLLSFKYIEESTVATE